MWAKGSESGTIKGTEGHQNPGTWSREPEGTTLPLGTQDTGQSQGGQRYCKEGYRKERVLDRPGWAGLGCGSIGQLGAEEGSSGAGGRKDRQGRKVAVTARTSPGLAPEGK